MERSLRLHLLSSAVCVQPLRRSGTLRSASRQRAQRGRLRKYSTRSWRVNGARSRASISAPTLASLTLKSMIAWKPSGSSMRSGFRPTAIRRHFALYLLCNQPEPGSARLCRPVSCRATMRTKARSTKPRNAAAFPAAVAWKHVPLLQPVGAY